MKEKLQILEEQIRKDLPRLLEPTDGCLFKGKTGIIHTLVGYNDVNEKFVFKCMDTEFNELFNYIEEINFEIIGHDILLSDVLDWLKIKQFFIDDIYVDFDGYFGLLDMSYEKFKCFKVHWNLSNPYLKDQSDKLIDFLYNLIDE